MAATTLKQIALKTGLSIPTVHQILNGYKVSFAASTRQKVIAAAAELNYRPNITARSLVTQRSFLVGVLFYGPNYPIITPFLRGLQAIVKANGCSPIFLMHNSVAEEMENLQSVLDRRVDGLIVNVAVDADSGTNAAKLKQINSRGLPMVEVFGRFIPGVPKVTLDYRTAAAVMTRRLLSDGHTRIALLIREGFRESNARQVAGRFWSATEFWQGHMAEMKAGKAQASVYRYPVATDNTRENSHFVGALQAAPELLAGKGAGGPPTAVVCYTSEAAEALMRVHDRLPGAAQGQRKLTIAIAGESRPAVNEGVEVLNFPFPSEMGGQAAAAALFGLLAGQKAEHVALAPAEMSRR